MVDFEANCLICLSLIENKFGSWISVSIIAPIFEKMSAKSTPFGCPQKAGRDNLIGIDVVKIESGGG